MYKIIGADGKEYGPVSVEQLRQWHTEGRVNSQTRVLAAKETEWRALGDVPELAATQTAIPAPAPIAPVNLSFQANPAAVKSLVQGPAIFILVLSILNLLMSIASMFFSTFQSFLPTMAGAPAETIELQKNLNLFFSLPANILGMIMAGVCLFGSIRMLSLKSYGLAMATAIMMLIPCGGCCCCLNIGAGIWALIVLSKPEVKDAFN